MRKIIAVATVTSALVLGLAAPAAAGSPTNVILLPGATSAESITAGEGGTFYAADLFQGTIYQGNVHTGTAAVFIRQPATTEIDGLTLDERDGLLFASGGTSGKAYVYNVRTRTLVATYNLGDPLTSQINDATLTPFGVWFDDSTQPKLYFVPIVHGVPGPVRTLALSGPAAGAPGTFAINDITSTPSGDTLLVAPATLGKLVTINPVTGTSKIVKGADIPATDGILLDGRQLWATQWNKQGNKQVSQVSRLRLSEDLSSATLEKVITSPEFHAPLTSVRFGDRLGVVNSHIDTGFPPVSKTYEVVVLHD
jgi:sugar lactone lactonase YvrE